MSPKPLFFAIFLGNVAIYFGIFWSVYEIVENLLIAELIIVFMDAGFIKLLAGLDFFQLDSFRGMGWKVAVPVSIIGNALSYYVGTIIYP